MQAAAGGLLTLSQASVANDPTGVVLAAGGGHLDLVRATITGGAVSIAAGGLLTTDGGTSYVDAASFTNQGGITIANGAFLATQGMLANSGTVTLAGVGNYTRLVVGAAGVSLTGAGAVILSDQAANDIVGAAGSDVLTNVNNKISGAADIGHGLMTLVNRARGVINATGTNFALILNTGANTIVNAGKIEATGKGGAMIESALNNTGTLEALGGALSVEAAVTGTGSAIIKKGALDFASSFSQDVAFTGITGTLELAQSQGFSGTIAGFSKKGKTALDLRDIGFVSVGEATFSGTAASGVLTVSDGTHTASIHMTGDFTGATFTASSDSQGGVTVVSRQKQGADAIAPPPTAFVAAMASLASSAGRPIPPDVLAHGPATPLIAPARHVFAA